LLGNILLGILAVIIYCILGYSSSGEDWDWAKFLRTMGIALATVFGLQLAPGLNLDMYQWAVTPLTITVILKKTIDSFKTETKKAG